MTRNETDRVHACGRPGGGEARSVDVLRIFFSLRQFRAFPTRDKIRAKMPTIAVARTTICRSIIDLLWRGLNLARFLDIRYRRWRRGGGEERRAEAAFSDLEESHENSPNRVDDYWSFWNKKKEKKSILSRGNVDTDRSVDDTRAFLRFRDDNLSIIIWYTPTISLLSPVKQTH